MDQGTIEREAVYVVASYLNKCPKLVPDIDSKGNTPIWDGSVTVYKTEKHTIKNFFACIRVQVKGSTVAKGNTFLIGREHIDAYRIERGTAFFLVHESDETNKILFALLSTDEIDILLKKNIGENVKIELQEVPKDPIVFQELLYQFATNRNTEKVEYRSPKEVQNLVDSFEKVRKHINEFNEPTSRFDLESLLDSIKNLNDDGTAGWRDKFIYYSKKAIELIVNNNITYDSLYLQYKFGVYLHKQKLYQMVEGYYVNSLKGYRKLAEEDRNQYISYVARVLNSLANLHYDQKKYNEAEDEYKEVLVIYSELAQSDSYTYNERVIGVLQNIALIHSFLLKNEEAEKEYKVIINKYWELLKNKKTDNIYGDLASAFHNWASILFRLGRYENAEVGCKIALGLRRELAESHPSLYMEDVAGSLNNLALLHTELKKYEIATKEYEESLDIYKMLVKKNHNVYIKDYASTLFNLAHCHIFTNNIEKAENELSEVLEILRCLAKSNPDVFMGELSSILNDIAVIHKKQNRFEDAEVEYIEALELRRGLAKLYPSLYLEKVVRTLGNLAILYNQLGRMEEAIKAIDESYDIANKLAEEDAERWIELLFQTMQLLNTIKYK